jgi:hypothetical protein
VRVTSTVTGEFLETALDARRTGYLPAAVFVAIAFVSRLPRKRKAVVVSLGLALLSLLSLLPVLSFFSGRLPIVALELSGPSRVIVDVLYRSLVAPLGMAYAVPALLWALLSWLIGLGPSATQPCAQRETAGPREGTRRIFARRRSR